MSKVYLYCWISDAERGNSFLDSVLEMWDSLFFVMSAIYIGINLYKTIGVMIGREGKGNCGRMFYFCQSEISIIKT